MKPRALILLLLCGCAGEVPGARDQVSGSAPLPNLTPDTAHLTPEARSQMSDLVPPFPPLPSVKIQSRSGVLPPAAATIAFLPVTVNLIWNPDENEVAGYNLYYGPESRTYLNSVGTSDTNAVLNLRPLQVYFFAVTAVSQDGTESDFSEEIIYQPAPQLIQLHFPEPTSGIQFSTDLVNWADLPDARQTNGDWFVNAP